MAATQEDFTRRTAARRCREMPELGCDEADDAYSSHAPSRRCALRGLFIEYARDFPIFDYIAGDASCLYRMRVTCWPKHDADWRLIVVCFQSMPRLI